MRWPERAALILAALMFVLLAVEYGRPYFTSASMPTRGIRDPLTALQMARSVADVDAVLSEAPSPDREVMRLKEYIDFVSVASYTALFLLLGWIFSARTRWAWLIAAFGVLAAFHNVIENLDTLYIVNKPLGAIALATIAHVRRMGLAKWVCDAAALFTLGMFTRRGRRWYFRLISAIELAAPAFVAWGLTDNPVLVWIGLLLSAALIANAATLKFLIADIAKS